MNQRNALALATLVLAAAACSDSPTVSEPTAAVPAPNFDLTRSVNGYTRHVLPTRELADQINKVKPSGGGGGGTGIYYHGGPVLQAATNVVAVYWSGSTIYNGGPAPGSYSTSSTSGDGSLVGYFLGHLGGSRYFNINTTYTDGSGRAIANVVNYTGYWANNQSPLVPSGTQNVSDADMVAMLQYGFDHGYLVYDASTLYNIFSNGTVNLGGGYASPLQYCAYHTHGTVTVGGVARTVLYSAMPYNAAYPASCSSNASTTPNGDKPADYEVNTLAHEIEETTTDMLGSAWWDRRGYENADKCAWQWGTTFSSGGGAANIAVGTKNFLVQMNWINSGSGGCRNSL
ncbi:MAG TPA: hypothetical protein VFJ74_03955 [Gemmatimonadaceae bacterium]|nr:hypothetical protein [Gemmatimonadaceae bacterium]